MDAPFARRWVLHGLVAGLLAGLTVALWFLILDTLQTEPFDTPAMLASTLLGEAYQWPTTRLVATYSVLHVGVFAVLGLAAGGFVALTRVEPGLLVGAVFGVGVLTGVYYASRFVAGVDVLTVLPAVHVLAANLMGGMIMMAYLHRALRAEQPLGPGILTRSPVLFAGLGVGLAGAGAVALWFLIVDVMTGMPFETPAALGSALFLGAGTPSDVEFSLATIGAYTVVHVAAFWVVGSIAVWVAQQLERQPGLWLGALLAFIVLEGLFIGVATLVGSWVLGALSWWAVGLGNLLAVGTMGWVILQLRPELGARLASGMADTQI